MLDEALFWYNHSLFAGGEHGPFLDLISFRKHLNKFFRVGSAVGDGDRYDSTHWYFKVGRGRDGIMDSIEMGHQPSFDTHCTMFSLYYELYLSEYRRRFRLQELVACRSQLDYIGNLIKIYSALALALRDSDIVDHIYSFKPWKKHGEYLSDGECSYSDRAMANVGMLRELAKKKRRGDKIYDLFKHV